MSEASAPKRELSNTELTQLVGAMARRIDQQTASFAALAGVLATLTETSGLDVKLAMSATRLMVPKNAEHDGLRQAAAANTVAIVSAAKAIDAVMRRGGVPAQA